MVEKIFNMPDRETAKEGEKWLQLLDCQLTRATA